MGKMKILLVDDDVSFLEIMRLRIEGWGYDLVEAVNGREAIDIMTKETPDIIILDYMLPDMDGVATLKEIRAINKKVPVIMFTAHADMRAMEETEELGISAFLSKFSIYTEIFPSLRSAIKMIEKKLA